MRLSLIYVRCFALAFLLPYFSLLWGGGPAYGQVGSRESFGKVVLITSLRSPPRLFSARPDWIALNAESAFREAFLRSGYDIDVIHHARAADLHRVLVDPESIAVFWLSHSAALRPMNSLLGLRDTIANEEGTDVKAIFQKVGPRLRFLAVIGCQDQATLRRIQEQGYYSQHPDLRVLAFDHVVEAQPSLIYALNASVAFLGDVNRSEFGPLALESMGPEGGDWLRSRIPQILGDANPPVRPVLHPQQVSTSASRTRMRISREIPRGARASDLSELIFLDQGRFLGVMPTPTPGETQELWIEGLIPKRIRVEGRPISSQDSDEVNFGSLMGETIENIGQGSRRYLPQRYEGKILGGNSALLIHQRP